MNSKNLLLELLAINSPTFKEKDKADFLDNWSDDYLSTFSKKRIGNNIILTTNNDQLDTRIAFVGHLDTVPDFFDPYEEDGKIHGSGASDMQAGLACFLSFIVNTPQVMETYNVSIILYDKEEGTTLHDNGLKECITHHPELISNIDCAIVAEPTNNAIQLGCVGSLHATLHVHGKAAHSARPWFGKNALYEALPIIQKAAKLDPIPHEIFGVTFYDVLQITESESTKGRTTLPETWTANINYRFSPVHNLDDAIKYVETFVADSGLEDYELNILNGVEAGKVIEHDLINSIKKSAIKFEAKQAWTDVSQLTQFGIAAFNFGPGRQDQAHKPNEYVVFKDMLEYETLLKDILLGDES